MSIPDVTSVFPVAPATQPKPAKAQGAGDDAFASLLGQATQPRAAPQTPTPSSARNNDSGDGTESRGQGGANQADQNAADSSATANGQGLSASAVVSQTAGGQPAPTGGSATASGTATSGGDATTAGDAASTSAAILSAAAAGAAATASATGAATTASLTEAVAATTTPSITSSTTDAGTGTTTGAAAPISAADLAASAASDLANAAATPTATATGSSPAGAATDSPTPGQTGQGAPAIGALASDAMVKAAANQPSGNQATASQTTGGADGGAGSIATGSFADTGANNPSPQGVAAATAGVTQAITTEASLASAVAAASAGSTSAAPPPTSAQTAQPPAQTGVASGGKPSTTAIDRLAARVSATSTDNAVSIDPTTQAASETDSSNGDVAADPSTQGDAAVAALANFASGAQSSAATAVPSVGAAILLLQQAPGNRAASGAASSLLDDSAFPTTLAAAPAEAPTDASVKAAALSGDTNSNDPSALAAAGVPQTPMLQAVATPQAASEGRAPTRPVPVLDQVSSGLFNAANTGTGGRYTVILHPKDLGRVDIDLKIDANGTVSATLSADQQATLSVLQQGAHVLERSLQDAGMNLDSNSLNFGLRDQTGGNGDGADQGARRQGRGGAQATPEVDAEAAPQRRVAGFGLVDISV